MKELKVTLNHFGEARHVGILAKKDRDIFFEYDKEFLNSEISISPYSLPLSKGLKKFKNYNFSDLFGGLSDSLPDGWGLLLMDRWLKQCGYHYEGLTSFERLSLIGKSGMGALEYYPVDPQGIKEVEEIDLALMSKNALALYSGESDFVIEKLANAGGSPGGARPKIIVTEKGDGSFVTDHGEYELGDKHWLIKFDVSKDFEDFARVEYFYSLLAKKCGIDMPETKLFSDLKGKKYFGVERFDRDGRNKIHTHTFGSLIESNFRIPDQEYKNLFQVTIDLTKNLSEAYKVFRLMVFNHLSTNQDDHVKNFSFILGEDFRWRFAPAYDLTPSFGMNNWQSMTISKKGLGIKDEDYLVEASKAGLNKRKCLDVIAEVKDGISNFSEIDVDLSSIDKKRVRSYLRI